MPCTHVYTAKYASSTCTGNVNLEGSIETAHAQPGHEPSSAIVSKDTDSAALAARSHTVPQWLRLCRIATPYECQALRSPVRYQSTRPKPPETRRRKMSLSVVGACAVEAAGHRLHRLDNSATTNGLGSAGRAFAGALHGSTHSQQERSPGSPTTRPNCLS